MFIRAPKQGLRYLGPSLAKPGRLGKGRVQFAAVIQYIAYVVDMPIIAVERGGSRMDLHSLDGFIAAIRAAHRQASAPMAAMRAVMRQAFATPDAVRDMLGEPKQGGLFPLYRAPELSIINTIWSPGLHIPPHNHQCWALIGIYQGQEDNSIWKRVAGDGDGRITLARQQVLRPGNVITLGRNIIHSVINPLPSLTGAIHIYGADFFEVPGRSHWHPQALTEQPYDMAMTRRLFGGETGMAAAQTHS